MLLIIISIIVDVWYEFVSLIVSFILWNVPSIMF